MRQASDGAAVPGNGSRRPGSLAAAFLLSAATAAPAARQQTGDPVAQVLYYSGKTPAVTLFDQTDPCDVVVLGKTAHDGKQDVFSGSLNGHAVSLVRVRDQAAAGPDTNQLWIVDASHGPTFDARTQSPDKVIEVHPGETVTIPPATPEQARRCKAGP